MYPPTFSTRARSISLVDENRQAALQRNVPHQRSLVTHKLQMPLIKD